MKVELHIEELVLKGLGGGRQHEIRAALERELADLLRTKEAASILSQGRDVSRMDAGSFKVKSTDTERAIGKRLAASVHRGLQRWNGSL